MVEVVAKPNILCNIHKEEITEIRKQISDISKDITNIKIKQESTNRLERMVETVTEGVNRLTIKTVEYEESLKRLDKIESKLDKLEYWVRWLFITVAIGMGSISGTSAVKSIFDYASSIHKTI